MRCIGNQMGWVRRETSSLLVFFFPVWNVAGRDREDNKSKDRFMKTLTTLGCLKRFPSMCRYIQDSVFYFYVAFSNLFSPRNYNHNYVSHTSTVNDVKRYTSSHIIRDNSMIWSTCPGSTKEITSTIIA